MVSNTINAYLCIYLTDVTKVVASSEEYFLDVLTVTQYALCYYGGMLLASLHLLTSGHIINGIFLRRKDLHHGNDNSALDSADDRLSLNTYPRLGRKPMLNPAYDVS
jgi:hypothetical protein